MNHSGRILLLMLVCIAEWNPSRADTIASEPIQPTISENRLRETTDSLFNDKQYGKALISYYRLLYSQTVDSSSRSEMYGRIGLCNYKQHKFALADSFFLLSDRSSTSHKNVDEKRISAAVLMLLRGRLGSSGRWLDGCRSARSKDRVDLLKRITELFSGVKTFDRPYLHNYSEASLPITDTLFDALLSYQRKTLSGNYLQKVLPGVASAVIPGSGQLLSGNIADGINSFLITGVCIGVTAWAYKNDNISLFTPAFLLSFNFYKGSIFNAVRDADERLKRESAAARGTIMRCLEQLFAPEECWD
jgi:hypothetical protein